jgi:hypothetical protein
MLVAFGVTQQNVGCARKRFGPGGLAAERGFRLSIAPGLVRNTPQREARLRDNAAIQLKSDCH